MIQELTQFTEFLLADDPALLEKNLRPRDGLHLLVRLSEDGSPISIHYTYVEKGIEYDQRNGQPLEGTYSETLQTCLPYQLHSVWIDANKAMDMGKGGKKIHSASPFVVAFKKDSLGVITTRYPVYFQAVRALQLTEEDEEGRQLSGRLEAYCQTHLMPWLTGLEVLKQGKKEVAHIPFKELKDQLYLSIYLENASPEQVRQAHVRYLEAKLFNTEDYNQQVDGHAGRVYTYGVSNYLNGLNSKKPFFLHHSAPFYKKLSGRITAEQALRLYQFEQLLTQNRALPNPLPIFVFQDELPVAANTLNAAIVGLYAESGEKKRYQQIVRSIYEMYFKEYPEQFGNYYLFYFGRGKEVLDVDFVSSFHFGVNWRFQPIFAYKAKEHPPTVSISNRFAIESSLLPIIFDNKLVVKKDDAVVARRYFTELDSKSFGYPEANTFRLIRAYRRAWYDYIYKSRDTAITGEMFGDMMLSGILEGFKRDEAQKNTFNLRRKANYWFGLNRYFDPNHHNFNGIDMASQIPKLLEKARAMKGQKTEEGESLPHLETDHEFAFMAGQVTYYLLSQSKADQKTHALFHPFLLKTSVESFRAALKTAFSRYGYDISQSAPVNRVMADVMTYTLQTPELPFSKLQPMMIAGYLADNVFYEKSSSNNKN